MRTAATWKRPKEHTGKLKSEGLQEARKQLEQPTPKPVNETDQVGIIAAWESEGGEIQVMYWGRHKLRHDKPGDGFRPKPLSPYWAKMYSELFKNW